MVKKGEEKVREKSSRTAPATASPSPSPPETVYEES